MPISGRREHEVEDIVHVGHLHGGPVEEDSSSYRLKGVGAGPGVPHFFRVIQLVKSGLGYDKSNHLNQTRFCLDTGQALQNLF